MSVSRGDVVLVDYPFSDRMGSKVRPALIVQVSLAPAPALRGGGRGLLTASIIE